MVHGASFSRKVFIVCNVVILTSFSLLCLLPYIHIAALSLSSKNASTAGLVSFWPVDFNLSGYKYVMQQKQFLQSFVISIERVILGSIVNMILIILTAYPLSKESSVFRWRTFYAWFFVFTVLFGGGFIPWYLTVRAVGLLDSIWALILPGAIPIFSAVVLLNFFRGLPKEVEESALMDGAKHLKVLLYIYIPMSTPAIATLLLFAIVAHWNSWFDGIVLMNSVERYPLQSYMYRLIFQSGVGATTYQSLEALKLVSERTIRAAQVVLGALPIVLVYPFFQKYFVKGIVVGSVKG